MLQIGIFGVGHLGKIHVQQWKNISQVSVVGFYEPDDTRAEEAVKQFGIKRFKDADELIRLADALDVVTPTIYHFDIAKKILLAGKHLFIEKPFTHSLSEAQELIKLVKEANVKCQVGHVERFNPALLALGGKPLNPMFIESHRLSAFNPRGTDVSVILDLMIHDIDIILHLVKSPVKRISASGVAVLSETPDIANARIEFDNGCVANLTGSRISMKKMRKMRLFQRDTYISIDFLEKKTEIIKLNDAGESAGEGFDIPLDMPSGQKKVLSVQHPEVPEVNAIKMELEEFVNAIKTDTAVKVSAFDGYQAMEVAHQILKKMSLHNKLHND